MTKPDVHLKQRAPRGVVSKKPISLRLMPNELDAVSRVARKNERSLGATARELVLVGLNKLVSCSASPGGKSPVRGAATNVASASFPKKSK